ncbi:MAG: FHA domain-containing protein [Herminiimonas sp.]|nr:FHA domain-containing protein [Herminiimonas sp.]
MAKIVLTEAGRELTTIVLSKDRITIGRRPENDVVIDDLAISGQHAVIVTSWGDSSLEDLNSTNGTRINGQPIKKHFLRDKDIVELAQYQLTFISDEQIAAEQKLQANAEPAAAPLHQSAHIKVLTGSSAGKEVNLSKALTTIGKPGLQVAVITRGHQGYSITHLEGETYPLVNGQSIGTGRRSMTDGDVIDLIGARMEFKLGAGTGK